VIEAYKDGIPGNGKPFPEGSKMVKIEWSKKKNPEAPAATLAGERVMLLPIEAARAVV